MVRAINLIHRWLFFARVKIIRVTGFASVPKYFSAPAQRSQKNFR